MDTSTIFLLIVIIAICSVGAVLFKKIKTDNLAAIEKAKKDAIQDLEKESNKKLSEAKLTETRLEKEKKEAVEKQQEAENLLKAKNIEVLKDTIMYNPAKMSSLRDLLPLHQTFLEAGGSIKEIRDAARAGLKRIYEDLRLKKSSDGTFYERLKNQMIADFELVKEYEDDESLGILAIIYKKVCQEEQVEIIQLFKEQAQYLEKDGNHQQISEFFQEMKGKWASEIQPYVELFPELSTLNAKFNTLQVQKVKTA